MAEAVGSEHIVEGLGVSPGVGIGIAHVRETGSVNIPEYRIAVGKVITEQKRLDEAVAAARRQIGRLKVKARERARNRHDGSADELDYLLDAYFHMLKDSRLVRGARERIASERINAEAAVQAEIGLIAEGFRTMQDPYLASRIDDIREVGSRLVRQLMKTPVRPLWTVPRGSVVVAEDITAADIAQMDPARVVAIAAQSGGPQSHTAIMARALGMPAVLGASGLLDSVHNGQQLLVDGDLGHVIVNPSHSSVVAFRRRRIAQMREDRLLKALAQRPAITRDGVAISLQANVELPIEMDNVVEAGAAGVGLLRSEFMFMNRPTLPTEEEQYSRLCTVVSRASGQPVTVRTVDFGGARAAAELITGFGDSACSPLGIRGIRLSLAHADLLETQFRAILRVATKGPVRVLLPMVTTVSEIRIARAILAAAARGLQRRGVECPDTLPPVGIMIEVPGAALSADGLAQVSDFFAIGSNDLTMYTLAIDRSDEHVAHLYNPWHPGVLRLIQFTAAAARRAGIPVSVCGEIAGDPRFTPLLLGLGLREMSMTASSIPKVKKRILSLDLSSAEEQTRQIMEQTDPIRMQMMIDDMTG